MSFHRILPPPSHFTEPPISGSDNILQSRVMTEKGQAIVVDQRSSPRTLQSGGVSARKRRASALDRDSVEDYKESPKILHANESAHTSNGVGDTSSKSLPPIRKPSIVSWSSDLPSQVCLCQPDPKVPRPRNAFILYRQHHQSAVVAQNPGLTNPEISKVIGDHWRTSPEEIKNHWKALAEEEKLRHHKQYPNYRYQPRRNARNNSVSSPNTATNPSTSTQRCLKCGGYSISTPSMTSAPTSASSGPYTPGLPVPTHTPSSSNGRFVQNLESPRSFFPPQQYRQHLFKTDKSPPLPSPRYYNSDHPLSPDSKRNRIDSTSYTPFREAAGPPTPFAFPTGRRRESLPRPDFMPTHNSGILTMGPPLRPPYYTRHGQQASLTLPPLQSSQSETAAKSVETMVMSIPALNKIKVLAKISPPMTSLEHTSSEQNSRGVIVAIEGADHTVVQNITEYLSTHLTSLAGRPLRTFQPPSSSLSPIASPVTKDHGEPTLLTYLQTIASYHSLSSEIISHISTHPTSPSSAPVSPKSTSPPPERKQIPIALVPSYQLTHTDTFATSVEIKDKYAPVDHWQWMATLWRGIVGPDITIVVKKALGNGTRIEEKGSKGLGIESTSAKGGVEVRLQDARAIIVTVGSGEKGIGEGELRRVGFEVGEWVLGREEGRIL